MATDNPVMEPADVFYQTAKAEDPEGQTEAEAVTESDDQGALAGDAEIDGQPDELSEESGSEGDTGDTEDGRQELIYLDLDGKEVDLDEVRKWRDGHLMQSDYTRKTTELADERKAVQAEREELTGQKANLSNMTMELQAMVAEDEAVNWDELREDDPEEYIAQKEKADKRKAMVEKLKSEAVSQPVISDDELVSEQGLMLENNPDWVVDGKATKAYEADQKLMNEYFQANGFTNDDVAGMFRARYIQTCLKAAKFDQLQGKASKIKSKVKKATLVTKPGKQARQLKAVKSREEIYYGKK